MSEALFITFEGGEGGGKSTQAKLLFDWMNERGIPCVLTKEPGTSYVEECVKIRELLLDPKYNLTASAELLLFLADRAQHVEKFILPTLKSGKHVICDRYSDSTRVYQSARGLSKRILDQLLDFATGKLNPDVTFLLDVPIDVGLDRAKLKSIYKDGLRHNCCGPAIKSFLGDKEWWVEGVKYTYEEFKELQGESLSDQLEALTKQQEKDTKNRGEI